MQKQKYHHNKPHKPVLLDSVLSYLGPKKGESYLDLTAGYGGHASAVIEKTQAPDKAVLVDRDVNSINHLKGLSDLKDVELKHQDFASAAVELQKANKSFDMVLIDLGLSSPQLDNPERGFSFMKEADLDMRMDQSQEVSAKDLVNTLTNKELYRVIREYGEESAAQKIADAIIQARPIQTTGELASAIEQKIRRRGKIHPATRTFQALRIAVNQELEQIQATLEVIPQILNESGRIAIISFHSLEDRLVKRFLQDHSRGYEADLKLLEKKAIKGADEDVHNPRARSAMLRVGVKINK